MSNKPTVFNYQDYEKAQEKIRTQQDIIRALGDRATMSVSDILEQVKADMCDDTEACKEQERDLIDRQAAIEAVEKLYDWLDESDFDMVLDCVKNIPSIPSEHKTERPDHGYMWICPKCDVEVHSDFDGCPHCGFTRADVGECLTSFNV